jgi:hypothetical protein
MYDFEDSDGLVAANIDTTIAAARSVMDQIQTLPQQNARLRRLLVQVSDLIRRNVVHSR